MSYKKHSNLKSEGIKKGPDTASRISAEAYNAGRNRGNNIPLGGGIGNGTSTKLIGRAA